MVAVNLEPFKEEHAEEGVELTRADGEPVGIFFIEVPTENLLGRIPASWNQDFIPAFPPNRTVPTIGQLMIAYDSRAHSITSGTEEAAPLSEEPPARSSEGRSQRMPEIPRLPSRGRVAFATQSAASESLASAGVGRRQAERLSHLYSDELDDEDEEDEVNGAAPKNSQQQLPPTEADLLSHLTSQGGPIDAQTLASLEMIRLIRDMREEDRRRRGGEEDDYDIFGGGKASTTLGKAIAGMTRHRNRIREQPRRICDEFRADPKLELNIKDQNRDG